MSTLALCIPAFNAAGVLPQLLASAGNQAIAFEEILVYDDCSTDDTKEVAELCGATVISGSINKGCSAGKNILAGIAKSDWLHFHDADDDLLPNFTTVAHKCIQREAAPDIILMHYQWIDFSTKKILGEPAYNAVEMHDDPVKFCITDKVVNFAVIRKSSFLDTGGFDTDPAVLYNEDRAFYTRAAINGLTFGYDPELTCINYFYPGSMSAKNKARCAKASLVVWKKVIDKTGGKYNAEITDQILLNATFAATANDWGTVKASIKEVQKLYPGKIPQGSPLFKKLYKLDPLGAFIAREFGIKYFTNIRRQSI